VFLDNALCELPGDGWDAYVKPFRTLEDIYVLSAMTAWLYGVGQDSDWPQALQLRLLALLAGCAEVSRQAPNNPCGHVLLGGLFAQFEGLKAEINQALAEGPPQWAAMWQRSGGDGSGSGARGQASCQSIGRRFHWPTNAIAIVPAMQFSKLSSTSTRLRRLIPTSTRHAQRPVADCCRCSVSRSTLKTGLANRSPGPSVTGPALRTFENYAFPPRNDTTRQGVRTDALLVIRDGQLIFERYAGPTTAATPHLTWSISKSLMATVPYCATAKAGQSAGPGGEVLSAAEKHPDMTMADLLHWASGLTGRKTTNTRH
jgi:hypothetical protein